MNFLGVSTKKMQREREGREIPIHFGSSVDIFGDIGGFRPHRSMASSIFGGRDPFDDPFFTRPFNSVFEPSMFGSRASASESPRVHESKGPVIEELNTDDEGEGEEEGGNTDAGEKNDKARKNSGANENPLVEHPDDQVDG